MDTPRSQRQQAPEPRKRLADRGGHLQHAVLLVALALGGCATAPPQQTYVAGTLPPACDSGTNGSTNGSTSGSNNGCARKSAPAPPQKTKCTGFLDLRVLYGTCSE